MFKKLFPKKGKKLSASEVKLNLRTAIKKVRKRINDLTKKQAKAKYYAQLALKQGNRQIARQMVLKMKFYESKIKRYNNLILRLEHQMEAIDEVDLSVDTLSTIDKSTAYISTKTQQFNTEKADEIIERANTVNDEVMEMLDTLAGEPELDLGLDITDTDLDEELDRLAGETLVKSVGEIPAPPESDKEVVPDIPLLDDDLDEDIDIDDKEKLKAEIDKLKKELKKQIE